MADGSIDERVIDVDGLAMLVDELWARGYEVWGPRAVDGVIAPALLHSIDELPLGWTDEQAGGHYRLRPRGDGARFGYAVGPRSWKDLLHPARQQVWTMSRSDDGQLEVTMCEPETVRRALIGVRPCELAAIAVQDRVLADGPHPDPVYRANRDDLLLVAVDCGDPAATCFCPSLGTGPRAGPGHDLALTELPGRDPSGAGTRYVVRVGTERGRAALAPLPSSAARSPDLMAARSLIAGAVRAMDRRLDTTNIRELIYDNLESAQWDDVAERCLACGNCTQVCPTCFCTDLQDVTDLAGDSSTRWRVWDTCFSTEFSHLGPGPVRASTAARYRQWFSHKLAGWIDQFGQSGCVGCGRCITWCPVGIDLTEELAVMRARAEASSGAGDVGP